MRSILTVFLSMLMLLMVFFTSDVFAIPFGDSAAWEGKYDADVRTLP